MIRGETYKHENCRDVVIKLYDSFTNADGSLHFCCVNWLNIQRPDGVVTSIGLDNIIIKNEDMEKWKVWSK